MRHLAGGADTRTFLRFWFQEWEETDSSHLGSVGLHTKGDQARVREFSEGTGHFT